jgi:hypothetical protein
MQNQRRNQNKIARQNIVSELYLRQYSVRQIRQEVMTRLDLPTCSTQTIHRDIQQLLEEWHDDRCDNLDRAITMELERIDAACRELWEAWESSKKSNGTGNVSFITEIRQQLQERRKLLGLYAPEKREVAGEMSFAAMLMESGMLDEATT